MEHERTVIVLAAGEGKRMKSALPKMLHPLLGRTLVGHVLAATGGLNAAKTYVVVGHGADRVTAHLAEIAPEAVPVLQAEQHGTGHAARVALEAAGHVDGNILIINGDVPMLRAETVAGLFAAHEDAGAAVTLLTAEVADPTGLGRILRNPKTGAVDAIVEERDATNEERGIREINVGVYAFDAFLLTQTLGKLTNHNDQGEEYLTDVVSLLVDAGQTVVAYQAPDPTEVLGCNDRVELAALTARMRDRINHGWMLAGVSMLDPSSTWVDVTVTLDRDVVLEPNTYLRGVTTVAQGASVGPDTTLIDTAVGEGATVVRTHAAGARIGAGATVGPYAYLRPGTVLRDRAKVGTFVEVKNSEIGAGSKVPHLSYVGDATIGENSNIGAATVFANYDGVTKSRSVVGDHVKTGTDNTFVAPVRVGDGAYTAAGSVITKDVPPGALGVARGEQRNVEGWVARKRPGSKAAQAAAAAQEASDSPADGDAGPAD